jgi:DNA-binding XRE family transcriptional regulator
MDLEQQKEVINLLKQYNSTSKDTIKSNLKYYIDSSGLKLQFISDQTGITIHTIYQIRKTNVIYKPDFITALLICDCIKIPITAILQESGVTAES